MTNIELHNSIIKMMEKGVGCGVSSETEKEHTQILTEMQIILPQLQTDMTSIKKCLMGDGEPGLKNDVQNHLEHHKSFENMSKWLIASIIIPIIALILSFCALQKTQAANNDEKVIKKYMEKLDKHYKD